MKVPRLSRLIQWNRYSQEEIHEIVRIYYESLGCTVYNIHAADRRGEKGADLVVTYPLGGNTLAIAVEKKPEHGNIIQLHELAERTENKKVYLYIEEPSASFREKEPKFVEKIDFWNEDRITTEISS